MVGALIGVGFERTIAKADAEKRKAYWRGRNSGRRGGKAAGLRAWFTRWNTRDRATTPAPAPPRAMR